MEARSAMERYLSHRWKNVFVFEPASAAAERSEFKTAINNPIIQPQWMIVTIHGPSGAKHSIRPFFGDCTPEYY
jgi:hypothetical protein